MRYGNHGGREPWRKKLHAPSPEASGSIGTKLRIHQQRTVEVEVALLNQLWLSQKRNALHVDFVLGAANSSVLDYNGRFWGTTAEVGLGFGGWGGALFRG